MCSHLVDALEHFIALGARRGVGEMLVLHVVGELGKILVTVGTGARGISEQSCNRESLIAWKEKRNQCGGKLVDVL